MRAILVQPDKSLTWSKVSDPVCKPGEVMIKVHAAAINRADLMQRDGDYPPLPGSPIWMGLEVAGEIVACSREAEGYRAVGQQVCALLGGGGYAEYVTVKWDMTMPLPKGVSLIEAAAMPEAFATAYLNLFVEGQANPGETLLMNAGASGLASVIIPMAKAFGLRVITTVMTDEIAAAISHLKADRIVVTSREDIAEVMQEELEAGHGVNIAIDCLGGEAVARCLPYMERDGRWIIIATLAGDVSLIDLKLMYKRSLRLIGNTLRARSPEMKAWLLSRLVETVWPKVEAGLIRPTIYKVLPIQQADEGQALLQKGKSTGKVVLTVGD